MTLKKLQTTIPVFLKPQHQKQIPSFTYPPPPSCARKWQPSKWQPWQPQVDHLSWAATPPGNKWPLKWLEGPLEGAPNHTQREDNSITAKGYRKDNCHRYSWIPRVTHSEPLLWMALITRLCLWEAPETHAATWAEHTSVLWSGKMI